MNNDLIKRTIEWNTIRGNTPDTLNWKLEFNMLQEEINELQEANNDVDRLDALLDTLFVAYGSLGKMGISADKINSAYEIVLKANESKSATKDENGKIAKPIDFVGPEEQLSLLLYPVD